MRILMASRRFAPDVRSGTETVFSALYERARRHHEVRLVVGWRNARHLVPSEAVAVDLRQKNKPLAWAAMARAIRSEASSFKPDVVLSNSIEVPPTGVRTAVIVHDLNFGKAKPGLGGRLRAGFYAARARALDRVITVSAASAKALAAAGLPPERVVVIHNGVDTATFRPDPHALDLIDPSHALHGKVRFAYPSRILPGKGQHLAIDAIARLPAEYKSRAYLTIVGTVADPIYLDQLRTQAANQPVGFAVDVPDIARFYQMADVVVFPTIMQEGFGFTAVEAMACGKPVIYSDQPAIREATAGIGIPVPNEDATALRDAMITLMDHPERRDTLGQEGLRYVQGNLDWDRVWERYDQALTALAREAR